MQVELLGLEMPILGTGNNPRSPGLHLSDVVNDLMAVTGMDQKYKGNTWSRQPTMNAGFVWEEVIFNNWEDYLSVALAKLMGRKLSWYQTGELEHDGIYLTPDGVDVTLPHPGWVLQEAKCTWKSAKNGPADNWRYMVQAKAYCMALGITQVMMHVLYLMGEYKGGGPEYKPWLITFTPEELAENWDMLKNHRDHMLYKGSKT